MSEIKNQNKKSEIQEKLSEQYENLLVADGLDDAIVGVTTVMGNDLVIYSIGKIVEVLMKRDGMTREEALEFFDFNIGGAYMGEKTPIYAWLIEDI